MKCLAYIRCDVLWGGNACQRQRDTEQHAEKYCGASFCWQQTRGQKENSSAQPGRRSKPKRALQEPHTWLEKIDLFNSSALTTMGGWSASMFLARAAPAFTAAIVLVSSLKPAPAKA